MYKCVFTIGVLSQYLKVDTHVIRFWESKFPFAVPSRTIHKQRRYTISNLFIFFSIKDHLHKRGYTVKGLLLLHKERGTSYFIKCGSILFKKQGYKFLDYSNADGIHQLSKKVRFLRSILEESSKIFLL